MFTPKKTQMEIYKKKMETLRSSKGTQKIDFRNCY